MNTDGMSCAGFEIRFHPDEGWLIVRDRPDAPRPWARLSPGVTFTDDEVADWVAAEIRVRS